MKKRFSEEQIIGFLREADEGGIGVRSHIPEPLPTASHVFEWVGP